MQPIKSLQEILPIVLQKRHLQDESSAAYILQKVSYILEEFFEPRAHSYITPYTFSKSGMLTFKISSHAALHLFKLQEKSFLKALQAFSPDIKKIAITMDT